jgi:purine nucleoside phosphorylase
MSMRYASLAVVANWAAGYVDEAITMRQIEHALQHGMQQVQCVVSRGVSLI